jgi:hypothetical protein
MNITVMDMEIYDLVLGELSQDEAFHPWRHSQESGGIGPRVLSYTSRVDADTLEWTLDCSHEKQFSRESIPTSNTLARNSSVASLEHYSPKHGACLVTRSQLSSHFNNPTVRAECGASRRCIIRFAVPGYANRRRICCVFFWFEDGGFHGGGTGLFCFTKHGGTWILSSRHIVYHRIPRWNRASGTGIHAAIFRHGAFTLAQAGGEQLQQVTVRQEHLEQIA